MERKVQRVEGVTGVRMRPGQAPRAITGYFGTGSGAPGAFTQILIHSTPKRALRRGYGRKGGFRE